MNTPYDHTPRYGVCIVSPCKDCTARFPACHSKFSLRRHGIAARSDQV